MAFSLQHVVPWGRTFEEYRRIFALTSADLEYSILGCGDGPASFNAELTERGGRVLSCDPLYQFSPVQLHQRVRATAPRVLRQTRSNRSEFIWDTIATTRELGQLRLSAMRRFLSDYQNPSGRYVAAALPYLPFADRKFDLALCSHFLFLYSEQLTLEFHQAALLEMLRVAGEVRIFPLLALGSKPSPHLEPVIRLLQAGGWNVSTQRVDYEFQKGGNTMLRVTHPA